MSFWSSVNSTQPPCEGAKETVCESWPTTPSTYVRSKTVPMTNARWTVDAMLAAEGLETAPPLVEAATPRAAVAEARSRRAPVLLSRHVIAQTDFAVVAVEGLAFPRSYVLVASAYGELTGEVRELVERTRDHVRLWLR